MSLDVMLYLTPTCPHCSGKVEAERRCVYESNITHNLNRMAEAAGIYQACWRPEEIGVTKAKQLVLLLRAGLATLRADPEHFRQYDAPNGWGRYDNLVTWVTKYLAACEEYPEADVEVNR